MESLSLHILDIAENSIGAEAKRIAVEIVENEREDLLTVTIDDDGKGMDGEVLERARDPFFTTKSSKRVGLGLALLSQASEQAGGRLVIDSKQGRGTRICATFQRSHPDMKPVGNMAETIAALIGSHPEIRFVYDHRNSDGESYHFDSHEA